MSPRLAPCQLVAELEALTVFLCRLREAESCFGLCWRERTAWAVGHSEQTSGTGEGSAGQSPGLGPALASFCLPVARAIALLIL